MLFVPNQSLGQIYMPLFVFLTIGREGDGVKEELNFVVMKYGVPQLPGVASCSLILLKKNFNSKISKLFSTSNLEKALDFDLQKS